MQYMHSFYEYVFFLESVLINDTLAYSLFAVHHKRDEMCAPMQSTSSEEHTGLLYLEKARNIFFAVEEVR